MAIADPPMPDGSDSFPRLWRHFVAHAHLRHWLMRAPPFDTVALTPDRIAEGVAFCCNFAVPAAWAHMARSFDAGEIFVPHHAHGRFMCGVVVAPTPLHKHLVCALGGKASRDPHNRPTYSTATRRTVVDMADPAAIHIIEFSWMQDGNLITTVKSLLPPTADAPDAPAGCTGAFAIFRDVLPGGALPRVPAALVSFIEAPRCALCVTRGAYSCYCAPGAPGARPATLARCIAPVPPPSSAVACSGHSFHNVAARMRRIRRMADVKITMHAIAPPAAPLADPLAPAYRLAGHRFDVRLVDFHAATPGHAHQLRQVADGPRLLVSPADATTMFTATTATTTTTTTTNATATATAAAVAALSAAGRDECASNTSSDAPTLATAASDGSPAVPGPTFSDHDLFDQPAPAPTYPSHPAHPAHPAPAPVPGAGHVLVPAELQLLPTFPVGAQSATSPRHAEERTARRAGLAVAGGRKRGLSSLEKRHTRRRAGSGLHARLALALSSSSSLSLSASLPQSPSAPASPTAGPAPRTTGGRLRCGQCAMTFSQKGSLNRHVKNVHDESKIPCEYCALTFGQMSDLQRHQQRKHRGRVVVTERRARVDAKLLRSTVANASALHAVVRGAT